MAITQIHAHQRNRHGSWRDSEGGALDVSRFPDPGVDGGADAAAPAGSRKCDDKSPRSHPHRWVTDCIAGGRQIMRTQVAALARADTQALAPAVYCTGRRPDAAGGWARAYEGGTSAQRKVGCCC